MQNGLTFIPPLQPHLHIIAIEINYFKLAISSDNKNIFVCFVGGRGRNSSSVIIIKIRIKYIILYYHQ